MPRETLVERLEKATGPDRELDGDLAVAIGYVKANFDTARLNEKDRQTVRECAARLAPRYTGEHSTLIPDDCAYALGNRNENNNPWACVTDANGVDYTAEGATPYIALCIAALQARQAND